MGLRSLIRMLRWRDEGNRLGTTGLFFSNGHRRRAIDFSQEAFLSFFFFLSLFLASHLSVISPPSCKPFIFFFFPSRPSGFFFFWCLHINVRPERLFSAILSLVQII